MLVKTHSDQSAAADTLIKKRLLVTPTAIIFLLVKKGIKEVNPVKGTGNCASRA